MALISIIVPVYNVKSYLRACLDSILDQDFRDIELVAVDDCSPDECGQIIDEYARNDSRIRPVHLSRNVGLGGARNAGLAEATGEYVWFVDSDDTITDGSLALIADRIRATTPDVMLIGYARTDGTGIPTRDALQRLLSTPGAPDVFRISERPELLQAFPTAWNKVVRRRFMVDAGLTFPAGWYEDLAFTYPLLATAARISVLDHVCYHYRQTRDGAILSTTSDRHFELIGQYDLVFTRLATAGADGAAIRSRVLGLAIEHCIVVLGHPGRLSATAKPRFFAEIVEFRRRHLPPGGDYVMPSGASKIRHQLIALGNWPTYRTLRDGYVVTARARRLAQSAVRRPYARAHLDALGDKA